MDLVPLVLSHASAEETVPWPAVRRHVPDGDALTRALIRRDTRDEQDQPLPRPQDAVDAASLRRLGAAWEAGCGSAPTHPRPVVPRRPPGNGPSGRATRTAVSPCPGPRPPAPGRAHPPACPVRAPAVAPRPGARAATAVRWRDLTGVPSMSEAPPHIARTGRDRGGYFAHPIPHSPQEERS
ncbi:hypothetical protein GCM10018785_23310 [Streptomyces longispororuber]|uniref:Uncharacterized protein n=1 Tax=Streptomyces longispororuber TaxID=68230 RepID=A0A918ZI82_9ACTN|nr:hypothetical protein GCM10018785_23310 [Streptomyces longispororuber]